MDRPDTASGTNSEMGLSAITLSKLNMLPEQWTLPQEWNIEKREVFANWKTDVQEQIKYLQRQLGQSLNKYPVLSPIGKIEEEGEYFIQDEKLVVGKMQLGVKRS